MDVRNDSVKPHVRHQKQGVMCRESHVNRYVKVATKKGAPTCLESTHHRTNQAKIRSKLRQTFPHDSTRGERYHRPFPSYLPL